MYYQMKFFHLDTAEKSFGTPFDCTIPLTAPYKGIKRIYLKSAEIPVLWKTVHAPLNSFTINSTVFTIEEGNYNINTILQTLNNISNINGEFSLNTDGYVVFSSSSGSRTLKVTTGDVLYMLGFDSGESGSVITANRLYNMSIHTFISIWMKNMYTSSKENSQISFKIPVSITNGSIYYYADSIEFCQYIDITDCGTPIDRFIIEVRDRFGNPLDNRGVDWTFSLACVY